MNKPFSFDDHVEEYEAWYDRYPWVFKSEVEALRDSLPEGEYLTGIEVGVGTGRFAQALGIKEGVEPSVNMRQRAIRRGIEIIHGRAEHLPYGDLRFDFVLMNFLICYMHDLHEPFREAFRVLKNDGALVVGFIDKDSTIGRYYDAHKPESTFYKHATFYPVEKVVEELKLAGFKHTSIRQTLFGALDEIMEMQPSRPGSGEGSFVVINAMKKGSISG